jgi:hypothetical protein
MTRSLAVAITFLTLSVRVSNSCARRNVAIPDIVVAVLGVDIQTTV